MNKLVVIYECGWLDHSGDVFYIETEKSLEEFKNYINELIKNVNDKYLSDPTLNSPCIELFNGIKFVSYLFYESNARFIYYTLDEYWKSKKIII